MIYHQKYVRLRRAMHILKIVLCTRAVLIHSQYLFKFQEHFGYFVKDLFSFHQNAWIFGNFPKKFWCPWGSSFWKASHLGLKVRTFFNSPGNADFENYFILKAKTVKTMTIMLTSYMTWNLKFDVDIRVVLFTVLAFPQQIVG